MTASSMLVSISVINNVKGETTDGNDGVECVSSACHFQRYRAWLNGEGLLGIVPASGVQVVTVLSSMVALRSGSREHS